MAGVVEAELRPIDGLAAPHRGERAGCDVLAAEPMEQAGYLTDGRDSLTGLQVIWRLYDAEDNGTIADLRGLRLRDRSGD